MRQVVVTVFVLTLSVSICLAQEKTPEEVDCSKAQTQTELNECACKQFQTSEAEMNRVYRELLSSRAKDSLVVAKLKNAQRAWLAFRNAQLELLYPETANPKLTYGSAFPMCHCMAKREMTEERTKQLRQLLQNKDGDVCGWSH